VINEKLKLIVMSRRNDTSGDTSLSDRSPASLKLWDISEGSDSADMGDFISSTDGVSSYSDTETQEWTNEDMAETNETIQMLEQIVKAQFSISDEVDLTSPFYVPADGIESPSSNFFRQNRAAADVKGQFSHPYIQQEGDYEPFEGKDSIFADVANKQKASLRNNSDYLERPPKSPASKKIDLDSSSKNGKRGKGITDPHLSDAVERASSKLRMFQRKIIRTIELTPEVSVSVTFTLPPISLLHAVPTLS
jgi:hypothetical protein